MSDSNSFRMRLDFALTQSGLSKADLARAIGETPQLINKWTNSEYKNLPAANYIAKVSKALKINMIWLVTGMGKMTDESNVMALNSEDELSDEFIQVPEYEVCFGAGACYEPSYEEVKEVLPATYRKEYFERRGVNPKFCKRFHVKGTSMQPLINDGDCILVDCEPKTTIVNGSVYALIYDHILCVKRLIKDFNRLIIKSDNKDYPDIVLTEDEAKQIIIVGKVIERSGSI